METCRSVGNVGGLVGQSLIGKRVRRARWNDSRRLPSRLLWRPTVVYPAQFHDGMARAEAWGLVKAGARGQAFSASTLMPTELVRGHGEESTHVPSTPRWRPGLAARD